MQKKKRERGLNLLITGQILRFELRFFSSVVNMVAAVLRTVRSSALHCPGLSVS